MTTPLATTTTALQAGELTLATDTHSTWSLHDLLTFASRQNPKRGYLFVSKVLGKHLPVCPLTMRATYDQLAELIGPGPSSYAVAMAETATGLGAGVADSLSRRQTAPVFYQHTTRHHLPCPLWFSLDEIHSHAVDHRVYQPDSKYFDGILQTQRLLLIDDEISTGRTLLALLNQLAPKLPLLREVLVVSLVNWLDHTRRQQFLQHKVTVRFINLLQGQFYFTPNSSFKPQLPRDIDSDYCTHPCRDDLGRRGILCPYTRPLPTLENTRVGGDKPLTVVGNGEHLFLPFLIAEHHALLGRDVLFQSTTRSPILLGEAIESKEAISIDDRPVRHYIYNLAKHQRQVAVLLEDESQRHRHSLARQYPIV